MGAVDPAGNAPVVMIVMAAPASSMHAMERAAATTAVAVYAAYVPDHKIHVLVVYANVSHPARARTAAQTVAEVCAENALGPRSSA